MNKGTQANWIQILFCFFLSIWCSSPSAAQQASEANSIDLALKSNLLYDATATINLGAEVRLSSRWSVDVSGNYNPFTFSNNKKWKHWFVQPEVRFWPRKVYQQHFFALHALGGEYNIGNVYLPYGIFKGTHTGRYDGLGLGVGIGYGYRQTLRGRWSLEAEVGVGYAHFRYDRFECRVCGSRTGRGRKDYLGPTKLALTLVYTLPVRAGKKCISHVVALPDTLPTPLPPPADTVRRAKPIVQPVVVQPIDTARLRAASFYLTLHYKPSSVGIYPDLGDNATQLSKLSAFVGRQLADTALQVRVVRVIGYCSIEGLAVVNNRISLQRARTVADYIRQLCPQAAGKLTAEGVGEDWDGLQQLVEQHADGFRGRDEALRIIRQVPVMQGRESQLMALQGGAAYQWMREAFFPQLRRVECRIEYEGFY